MAVLDLIPFEDILHKIENGYSIRQLAAEYGVSKDVIDRYLHADSERDNRVKLIRETLADKYIENAETVLQSALYKSGEIDATAAKNLAMHWEKRAGWIDDRYKPLDKGGSSAAVNVQINNGPLALPDSARDDPIAASKAYSRLIEG
jgi:hypothetical protein